MTIFTDNFTILIVDDTPSNLSVVVDLLEDRGYRVAVAQDGEEGLQRAQLVQPDLILLDVMLPDVDGFEICRRLKTLDKTRDIPVIFMTSLASTEHKVKGFAAGGVDYVTKPLQIEEVHARVNTHLKLYEAQRQLAAQNAQLEKQRDELELRVAERTAELAEREREFRTLTENIPDNIVRYNRQCRAIYVNPKLLSTLDSDASFLLGKTPQEAFPEGQFEAYQAQLEKVIETGEPGEIEISWADPAHGMRHHTIRFVADRDEQGKIVGALAIGRDITGRKRADARLALLGAAIDRMHEAAYLVNEDGGFAYVNEEASRALGYSREELLDMTVTDIGHGRTADMVAASWNGLTEDVTRSIEAEHRRKDGSIFPVDISISHLKHDGKTYALVMCCDITERKAYIRDLQRWRDIFENAEWGVVVSSADGLTLEMMNPEFARMHGFSVEELTHSSIAEVFAPQSREDLPAQIRIAHEKGHHAFESWHMRKDGSAFPVLVDVTVVRGADGQTMHRIVNVQDITERKEAERLLHEREQAIRAVVENSPDPIARYDAQFRRVYVNPAKQKLFSLSLEQPLGRTEKDVSPVHPDFMPMLRRVFESGEEFRSELPFRGADGEMGWGDVRFVPEFGPDGNVATVLSVGRDITSLKDAEWRLKESHAQLQDLAARREAALEDERKRIARDMHDELGQYLTALRMGISVLRMSFGEREPKLQEQVQGMMSLLDKTIQVVRSMAARLRPAPLEMGVVSALEWLAEDFSRRSGIACELDAGEGEMHMSDNQATAIFRIVQESLTNVARYADASRVAIRLWAADGDFALRVSDDGKGFDPDATRSNSYGLVGIRERAAILGGEAKVISAQGKGATIEVHIPIEEQKGQS